MTLVERLGEAVHIPAVAKEVFDVTGAGDTVIGVLALAVASGATLRRRPRWPITPRVSSWAKWERPRRPGRS